MKRMKIAVGPELPEFGSWNWIGVDVIDALSDDHDVRVFSDVTTVPTADMTIFLKFKPAQDHLAAMSPSTKTVFMPVDVYGSVAQIESDRAALMCFDLILVHCHRLVRYFEGISPTKFLDHSLKYIAPDASKLDPDGDLLWVGRSCNIGPVVDWVNSVSLDRRVQILTNDVAENTEPRQFGFNTRNTVVLNPWTEMQHTTILGSVIGAIDVKGDDFRSRHKPPAKVLDHLASGIPVIINRGSSADMHLQMLGIRPQYSNDGCPRWTDIDYDALRATAEFLRRHLARDAIINRLKEMLAGVAS